MLFLLPIVGKSSKNPPLIEENFPRLSIVDEEDGKVEVAATLLRLIETNFSLCLVGRFLVDKPLKFNFMYNTMASIWKPICGVTTKDLGDQRYLFEFYHE